MVYATVFDIVSQPDSYIGKNIRMEGIYNEFTDPESNITQCDTMLRSGYRVHNR